MTEEMRIHGRGGQGAVLAGEILVNALAIEGKSGASFPMFGFERRGAPVSAFLRIGTEPIRERSQVYSPAYLLVLDPDQTHWPQTYSGVQEEATLIVNRPQPLKEKPHERIAVMASIDATGIALKVMGRAISNTCMLGAFAATTGWVALDSLLSALKQYFSGNLYLFNADCVKRGYNEVFIVKNANIF